MLKWMVRAVGAWLAALSLCVGDAQACIPVSTPFTGIDPKEFVFLGEVTGYTPLSDPTSLVLRVLAVIQAPVDMGHEIELRNESPDDSACAHTTGLGAFHEWLIGSRLKVIAGQASLSESKAGKPRLVLDYFRPGFLAEMKPASGIIEKDIADVNTELNSRFMYRCHGDTARNGLEFARRQDAWRLKRSPSEADSLAILMRMASCAQNDRLLLSAEPGKTHLPGHQYGGFIDKYLHQEKHRSLVREKLTVARYMADLLPDDEKLRIEKRKAAAGNGQFQMLLGTRLLETGQPGSRDEGLGWLNKSARSGFVPAYWALSIYYSHLTDETSPDNLRWRREQQRAIRTGLTLARRGVAGKDPVAIATLAAFYLEGHGVGDLNKEEGKRLACQLDFDEVANEIYPLNRLLAEAGCGQREP